MRSSYVTWSTRCVALLIASTFLFTSCGYSSRMNTNPEGAIVYINGIPIGTTPIPYRYRSGTPETIYVKIEKPGYKSLNDVTIDKTYHADVSLVLLICAIVPYFFSARLEEQYIWNLLPADGAAGTVPAPSEIPAPIVPPTQ